MLNLAMPLRRKTWLIVLGIAALLLGTFIFAVAPALMNADRYRPQVVSYLQEKTGKQVEIGRLTLSFSPLSIRIDDFAVKNPRLFGPGYVVKVPRIEAELEAAPLLHRQVVIKSLVLEDPVINLISDPDGPWNFENPQPKPSQNGFTLPVISKLEIKGGRLALSNLIDPSDKQGPIFLEARGISCELEQVNLAGIINPASSTKDGQGSLKASLLRFGALEAKNLDSKVRLQARQVFFTQVKAQAYGGSVAGDLSFNVAGKNHSFKTNAKLTGMNVAQLLAAFPSARGRMTGNMEGEVKLTGEIKHSLNPLAEIRGTGHVAVRNGEVPSLELNANLMKLAHFNNLGPAKDEPASFNLISTDLELADQRISSRVIDIDGYGVDVDGAGSVSVSGSDVLDYRGLAEITTKQGFFTNTIARLSGATLKDGKLQFPFQITGTIDSPVFSRGGGAKDVDAAQKH